MLSSSYDVVIVGASFSGLTLAHHLPHNLNILIIDSKPAAGASVESTGLITQKTREEFATFFDIDAYITNPITSICVVAPGFTDHFVSSTSTPWIYQTDTRELVRHLAHTLPTNVTFSPSTTLVDLQETDKNVACGVLLNGTRHCITALFCVGADGARSKVSSLIPELDRNTRFLFGYEHVYFGRVLLSPQPEKTIIHFWFGEFSLGYGGWLSPTVVNGKPAFRIGLAKLMKDRGDATQLMDAFINTLRQQNIIQIADDVNKPEFVFGSMIPIGGTLQRIHTDRVLLIGDAAGFCGAFAADGIKGSVVSGKEAAHLIPRALAGDRKALTELPNRMNTHGHLMDYYGRQIRYRFIWDLMRRNRSFRAMYDIIEKEKESFLEQFCDGKDARKSLAWVVLKPRHLPRLIAYAGCLAADLTRYFS